MREGERRADTAVGTSEVVHKPSDAEVALRCLATRLRALRGLDWRAGEGFEKVAGKVAGKVGFWESCWESWVLGKLLGKLGSGKAAGKVAGKVADNVNKDLFSVKGMEG